MLCQVGNVACNPGLRNLPRGRCTHVSPCADLESILQNGAATYHIDISWLEL